METRLFGIQSTNFELLPLNNLNVPFKVTVTFNIEDRESDAIITLDVEIKARLEDKQVVAVSTSRTGYLLTATDRSFLGTPTNPKTLSYCLELSRDAIAHARVFLMLDAGDNQLGPVILRNMTSSELETLTREGLMASMN